MPSKGYANDNGIIFSSLNSVHEQTPIITNLQQAPLNDQVSNSVATLPTAQPSVPVAVPINVSNIVDFEYYVPQSPLIQQPYLQQQLQQQPQKPQSSFSSNTFTFAPLLAIPMISTTTTVAQNAQKPASTVSATKPTNFPPIIVNPNPSSSAFSSETNRPPPANMIMTKPPNQCGISNYTTSRVVGGAITQLGNKVYLKLIRFINK